MAKAEANEIEFANILNSRITRIKQSYRTMKMKTPPITIKFIGSNGVSFNCNNVDTTERKGDAGFKTDLHIKSNTPNESVTISIKDNSSVYWDSSDVYIRNNYGDIIRKKLIELSEQNDVQNELTAKFGSFPQGGRRRPYDIQLSQYFGYYLDIDDMSRAVFGTIAPLSARDGRVLETCQYVIRHEIIDNNVKTDIEDATITVNVGKIYRSISDIEQGERPALVIYPANRNTFRIDAKQSIELNKANNTGYIEQKGFRGVRGAIRTLSHVQTITKNTMFTLTR